MAGPELATGVAETDKQTVLVVEDETLLRMIGSNALSDAGYEVIEAENAKEALAILEKSHAVHLMFTDIRMPGPIDGLKLAEIVHDRWPNIRLLVTSGDTWPSDSSIPDDGQFLPKPYRLQTLQDKVDGLLSE